MMDLYVVNYDKVCACHCDTADATAVFTNRIAATVYANRVNGIVYTAAVKDGMVVPGAKLGAKDVMDMIICMRLGNADNALMGTLTRKDLDDLDAVCAYRKRMFG